MNGAVNKAGLYRTKLAVCLQHGLGLSASRTESGKFEFLCLQLLFDHLEGRVFAKTPW